jgi:hypothetical protein
MELAAACCWLLSCRADDCNHAGGQRKRAKAAIISKNSICKQLQQPTTVLGWDVAGWWAGKAEGIVRTLVESGGDGD